MLEGIVDPLKAATVSWFFEYKAGSVCTAGSTTPVEGPAEVETLPVAAGIESLTPNTKYTVCLVAENAAKETTAGSPVTFRTALPPEKPDTTSPAKEITATTATLEGVLNPKSAGEAGSYEFLYRVSPTECEGESATPAEPALGHLGESVKAKATPLQPSATYTFCLLARNTAGEAAVGPVVHFTTPPGPPAVDGESVVEDTPTSATLQAQINPNNQKTTYLFEYSTKASGETLEGTVTTIDGGSALPGEYGDQTASVPAGALTPGTAYYYRVVATNGTPPASQGKVEHFATPETPIIEAAVTAGASSVLLKGELNPNGTPGAVTYQFDYNTNGTCEPSQGSTSAVEVAEGKEDHVEVEAQGLEPSKQYTFCLVATNASGGQAASGAFSAQTSSVPPVVESVSVSDVGSRSASLNGQVDLSGSTGSYFYEYGTSGAFASSPSRTPEASLAAGGGSVEAPASLAELTPGSEYQIRLIVKNENGEEAEGAVQSFTTFASTGAELPDGRVYEMVTPVENHDANVYIPQSRPNTLEELNEGITTYQPFDIAADGSAVAYISASTTGGEGQNGAGRGDQELAVRGAAGGWTQTTLQPDGIETSLYQGFSSDLAVGFLTSGNPYESQPPLSPEAPAESGNLPYVQKTSEPAGGSADPYSPLVTAAMHLNRPFRGFERPPPFPPFGPFGAAQDYVYGKAGDPVPRFAGGSAGYGDVLFEVNDSLLVGSGTLEEELQSDVRSEIGKEENSNYLYDSMAGKLVLIDVSPEGKVVQNANFGGPQETYGDPPAFSNVISADGNRVYWSSVEGTTQERGVLRPVRLWVRINPSAPESPLGVHGECVVAADACTLPVSAGPAEYLTSADDGRYAFYLEDGALYRFDIEGKTPGETRETLAAPEADVQGILGVSEDGGQIYFAAGGALASGATPAGECTQTCNLYSLRVGTPARFVALLSAEDGRESRPFWHGNAYHSEWGDWQAGLGQRTAEVSGDGGVLVFQSAQNLPVVGYPRGFSSAGAEEVYLYEAGSGELHCLSCSSTGEAPPSGGTAAFLPISWADAFQPRVLSDDGGRVFFDSAVPLVAQDTNGVQDVYEWEKVGVGTCTSATAVDGGCVYLLSGGVDKTDSVLIGASESGEDVFIATRAQLAPEDRNENFDLYDARVGGVRPVASPVCTGTGCQGVPAPPPTFATPPSVTFAGVGNFPAPAAKAKTKAKVLTTAQKLGAALRTCKKHKQRKRRASCEARAHKRYSVKKAKKAGKASLDVAAKRRVA